MRPSALVALAGLVMACGPQAIDPQPWMTDTFSSRPPEFPSLSSLLRYEVHDDGTVDAHSIGTDGPIATEQWDWEPIDDQTFDMYPIEDSRVGTSLSTYRVRRGEACGPYPFEIIYEGVPRLESELWVGVVCQTFRECPEDGSFVPGGCGDWETVWCDGPPDGCQ